MWFVDGYKFLQNCEYLDAFVKEMVVIPKQVETDVAIDDRKICNGSIVCRDHHAIFLIQWDGLII